MLLKYLHSFQKLNIIKKLSNQPMLSKPYLLLSNLVDVESRLDEGCVSCIPEEVLRN